MTYLFDGYELDPKRRELRRAGARIDIEPQVFDLLEYLIRTRDRVASRDDLLEAVWQGRIVSESTLSSRINAARTAIGDDGTAQRLIRTLPRKGIRFVGDVKEGGEAPAPLAPVSSMLPQKDPRPGTAAAAGPAIAVLPFNNMSGDPESDYFADGMAEEIITALARCGGILVIARNSSFIYKGKAVDVRQVGRELGVGYVLEGSVRRHQDRLRITTQLIEASAGTHLWADRFDGSLSDVFGLQDRIAETAAAIIEPKLRFAEVERVRQRPTNNLDAYELWLRAVWCASEFSPTSMTAALRYLEQALELDSSYAMAMASSAYYLALCRLQGWTHAADDAHARASRFARDAVEIARHDPNVLWQSAFAIWHFEHDAARALELFRRALMHNPSSAIALAMAGWVEAANGDPKRGRELVERSHRLSPRHPRGWFMATAMAIACVADRDYPVAIEWAEKAVTQNHRFAIALRVLAVALVNDGQLERAKGVIERVLALEPNLTISEMSRRLPPVPLRVTFIDSLRTAGLPE